MWKYFEMWKNNKIKRDIKELNYEDVKKSEYLIIDVRTRKEYLEGHIDGAINIPLANIKKNVNNIDKDSKILLYCQSGIRSKKALIILENLGYINVYNLKGGLENI